MPFDPDAYLSKTAPAFDPDAYLISKGVQPASVQQPPQEPAGDVPQITTGPQGQITQVSMGAERPRLEEFYGVPGERRIDRRSMNIGMLMTTNPDKQAQIVDKYLGDRGNVSKDEEGNYIVELDSGQKFYVNKPGVSMRDLNAFTAQMLAFMPTARLAGMAKGLFGRALAGGGAAGTAEAGLQFGAQVHGAEDFDWGQVGITALVGGAADVLAPHVLPALKNLWRRQTGKELPGAFYNAEGELTEAGRRAFKARGIKVEDLTDEAQKLLRESKYAQGGYEPSDVLRRIEAEASGTKPTRGAITKEPEQMAKEAYLARQPTEAGEQMREVQRESIASMEEAAQGIVRLRPRYKEDLYGLGDDVRQRLNKIPYIRDFAEANPGHLASKLVNHRIEGPTFYQNIMRKGNARQVMQLKQLLARAPDPQEAQIIEQGLKASYIQQVLKRAMKGQDPERIDAQKFARTLANEIENTDQTTLRVLFNTSEMKQLNSIKRLARDAVSPPGGVDPSKYEKGMFRALRRGLFIAGQIVGAVVLDYAQSPALTKATQTFLREVGQATPRRIMELSIPETTILAAAIAGGKDALEIPINTQQPQEDTE